MAKGKWQGLKGKLRRFVPDMTFQDRVDDVKKVWVKLKPQEMGEELKKLKLRKIAIEDEEKEINLKVEALSQLLCDWMEREEIESFRLASGGVITNVVTPYPRVTDETEFMEWLKENEPDEKLKLPWPSLDRIVRTRLEEGQPLPQGVEVFIKDSAKLYGGRAND